jgi:hypothetical protein
VYNNGTLTIAAASLTVTANAQTKAFGAPDPTLTYSVSGFMQGDNSGVLTGTLSRNPGESVGSYAITKGSLNAGGRYAINFVGNNLTITDAAQQITWNQSLLIGCNTITKLQLTATASSGLPVAYSVSDQTIATVSGNILTVLQPGTAVVTATQSGDANHTAATPVDQMVSYQPTSLIRQHWEDVIFFDNSSGDYVQWQWYKNGLAVAGDTTPYYSETPLIGQFSVVATNKSGQQIQSCILAITDSGQSTGGIQVNPNPIQAGAPVTVISNYPGNILQGAILQVMDMGGKVRQQLTAVQPSMQVVMPSETGIYIINLLMTNGQKASINVLVRG